jgi:hypothetical protein
VRFEQEKDERAEPVTGPEVNECVGELFADRKLIHVMITLRGSVQEFSHLEMMWIRSRLGRIEKFCHGESVEAFSDLF